jgi:hypothetical protein
MAGYSGTPLSKKLGLKPDHRALFLNAPDGFGAELGELPPGVEIAEHARAGGERDVIVWFVRSEGDLRGRFAPLAQKLAAAGGLWIAWPKKASGVPTDLDENLVREIGLAHGLVDNKVCAIDETWSGLRFVIRLKDRVKR